MAVKFNKFGYFTNLELDPNQNLLSEPIDSSVNVMFNSKVTI